MGWVRTKALTMEQPSAPSLTRWLFAGVLMAIIGVLLFILHASGTVKNYLSDKYLVGIPDACRMLVADFLPALLPVGQGSESASVLAERGGIRTAEVGRLGRALAGRSEQCSAVAGSYFCGALGE